MVAVGKLRRLPAHRVLPGPRCQPLQFRAQLAPRRRCCQQLSNHREPKMCPPFVDQVVSSRSSVTPSSAVESVTVAACSLVAAGQLLRNAPTPQKYCSLRHPAQRSQENQQGPQSPRLVTGERTNNALGSAAGVIGCANRPRANRQYGVCTNSLRHHRHQRSTVRRLTPTSSRSRPTRVGLAPCRSAATNTTISPRYTRRPRNLSDAGVTRLRHPSSAQQKLNRISYSAGSATPAARLARERRCGFRKNSGQNFRNPHALVQPPATRRANLVPGGPRQLPIRLQQTRMEPCVSQQLVPQRSHLLSVVSTEKAAPSGAALQASGGAFLIPAPTAPRLPAQPPRSPCPCSPPFRPGHQAPSPRRLHLHYWRPSDCRSVPRQGREQRFLVGQIDYLRHRCIRRPKVLAALKRRRRAARRDGVAGAAVGDHCFPGGNPACRQQDSVRVGYTGHLQEPRLARCSGVHSHARRSGQVLVARELVHLCRAHQQRQAKPDVAGSEDCGPAASSQIKSHTGMPLRKTDRSHPLWLRAPSADRLRSRDGHRIPARQEHDPRCSSSVRSRRRSPTSTPCLVSACARRISDDQGTAHGGGSC